MAMLRLRSNTLAALDVGSYSVKVLIAEVGENGLPIIKGYGIAPSKGIRKGLVVDIEDATQSVYNAVTQAEKMAETTIDSCYVSLSGDHLQGLNTRGMIAISRDSRSGFGEAREIIKEDIERLEEQTKGIPLPADRQILHVLAQEFIVDEHGGIKKPQGLTGRRLEAKVHIVTYGVNPVLNLSKCIKNAELEIDGFILSSLAAAYACLEESEREMQSVLLDIGGDLVDVIVFMDGGVYHTGVVLGGAASVTSDIAYMLHIPLEKAEGLKREYGLARISSGDQEKFFKINGIASHAAQEISSFQMAEWIEPRMDEILREALLEAQKSGVPLINTLSVVVCGGGAHLKGTQQIAESIFNTPVRVGIPKGFIGFENELSDPSFAVAIGLLKFALAEQSQPYIKPKGLWSKFKHLIENIM